MSNQGCVVGIERLMCKQIVLLIVLLAASVPAYAQVGGAGKGGAGSGGDASAANQTTIIGHVDGIEGLLTTIDADTGTISTNSTTLAGAVKVEDAAHSTGDTGIMSLCVRRDTAATSATTDGDYNPCATDASGRLHTTNPAIESTRMRVTMYDSSGAEVVVPTAGLTSYTAAGASTNATNVKNAAGTVYGYSLTNTTTTIYYLRMYNLASAPTCSSATGYVSTIPIPPASAAGGAGGREIQKNIGQAFTTGVGFCVTGGASSTDNTNAATGVFVEILYK